jgi:cyclopropane fatty-acyl-phospholipid synthase-like methyltransferase
MAKEVDLYHSAYGNLNAEVLSKVRSETYGEDIGQSSWITTQEYDKFYSWLELKAERHLLEVASGSGGPALYLTRKYECRITGIDINEDGLNSAKEAARAANISSADFQFADVDKVLPFENESFDAIMCIDAANHFRDRLHVLRQWHRVLKTGGRLLFTDPVVLTGPVSNEELMARSNIGFFLFMPLEVTERFITQAGFTLLRREDVTENAAVTSGRWHDARQKHRDSLLKIEGQERFDGLQRFLGAVHKLTSERRLSRFVFVAKK